MTERVLVTGARSAAALDIARALRAVGFEPHLADCSPARVCRWSNSAGPVHRHASPVRNPPAFAADMRALIARLEPVRIIPTCEEVFHLAALAQRDGFEDRLFSPPLEVLAGLHAKDRFVALCARLGLRAPETRTAVDAATLSGAVEALGDVVLKPVWSRFGSRTLVSPSPARVAGVRPIAEAPWVVQRRVRGEDVSFYALCHDGGVAAFSAYGSDHRTRGGAALAFRPLAADLAEPLRAMAERLADCVGTGQVSCDAIIDAGGQAWLIECNPRATSGVHLFEPAALGRALMDRGHAGMLDLARHLAPGLWGRRTRGGDRDAEIGRDVLAMPGDRWPLAGAVVDAAGFALAALARGETLSQAMTSDIEWNGRPFGPGHWL